MASKKKPQKKSSAKSRSASRSPQTMEELLVSAETPIQSLSRGQKIKGKIVSITKKNVVVDIGGKSEGLVAERAFQEAKSFVKTLKEGDEIIATVLIPETPDGFAILSFRQAALNTAWKKIEAAQKSATPLNVLAKSAIQAGMTVDVVGLPGFIPTSQLGKEVSKNPQALIGTHFKALVIDTDRYENKIVLSERGVSEADEIKLAKKALKMVDEKKIYTGKVTKIYAFGCFVQIQVEINKGKKVPVEGLVHVSELSWEKVSDSKEIVTEGEKVKVKIIGKKDDKLSLSMKQAKKDPWENAVKKYKKDKKLKGKVVRLSDYGVFVQLEPGVEGLIHMTKIPPATKLEEGKQVDVYVERIDPEARKLSLGLVLTTKPIGYK